MVAEVAVFTRPGGDPVEAVSPDGVPVIPVFTSQPHLDAAGRMSFEVLNVADLLHKVPEGHQLYINPASATPMRIELGVIRGVLADRAGETDKEPAPA
jgi:hypothetical protein